MKKKFRVCIASRYMYNDYRAYDIYFVNAISLKSARRYAKSVITNWNKKDHSTSYEVFSIEEEI